MSIASHRSVSTEHSSASHRSAATRRVISSQRIASPEWIGLSSHIASDVCSIVFQRHDGMQSSYRPEHEAQSIALSTKIRKPLSEHGPDQPGLPRPRQAPPSRSSQAQPSPSQPASQQASMAASQAARQPASQQARLWNVESFKQGPQAPRQ